MEKTDDLREQIMHKLGFCPGVCGCDFDGNQTDDEQLDTVTQLIDTHIEAILQRVETEVIGEDDDVTVTDNHKSPSKYRKGMNYLRAEQRKKLREVFNAKVGQTDE